MFDLYQEAASIIRRANQKEGSLKTLVYSSSYRNLRQLFALVSECVKYQSILKDVFSRCGTSLLNEEIVNNDQEMVVTLLYELLVGNGFGRNGFVRKVMRKYQAEIKTARAEYLKEHNATSLGNVLRGISEEKKALPRYARVNLIKCSIDGAMEKLYEDGWEYVGKLSIDKFQEEAASLTEAQFGLDPLLSDVLVFPAKTDLHDYALVTDGILVLQDKASCVPAHVLNPKPHSVVLDSCAAPGNKASHLASLMKDQGRVIALDRDSKRMSTMKSLLQRYGANCVEMIVQDFLTLSPHSNEVMDIQMMLVDPSCSGSGMPSTDRDINPQRLQSLKRFQISLLKHALRFPNIQRVVYSTCSIHQQENEEVVEEVMSNVSKYFHFVPVLPEWPDSRGLERFDNHKCFLRLSSEKHSTAGFFVACFERKKSSLTNCESSKEAKIIVDVEKMDSGCLDGGNEIDQDSSQALDSEMGEENISQNCDDLIDAHQNNDSDGKKKNKKKERNSEDEAEDQQSPSEVVHMSSKKKEKRKRKSESDRNVTGGELVEVETDSSNLIEGKKKKKHMQENVEDNNTQLEVVNHSHSSKKKKKRKHSDNDDACMVGQDDVSENSYLEETDVQSLSKKKKKKLKKASNDCDNVIVMETSVGVNSVIEVTCDSGKKKKRKN